MRLAESIVKDPANYKLVHGAYEKVEKDSMSRLLDHRGNPILTEGEKRLKKLGEATARKYMPDILADMYDVLAKASGDRLYQNIASSHRLATRLLAPKRVSP